MANEPHPELVIIRRHGGHEDDHHGGAWKIAFADFMTAMMALFLVLWLISATNPKQRVVISRYFNPVKLAEATTNKKGLNDPDDSGGPSQAPPKSEKEKKLELPPAPDKRSLYDLGATPKHDEAALFRDPYAVLSEIAGHSDQGTKGQASGNGDGGSKSAAETADGFRDPFTTIPQEEVKRAASNQNAAASIQAPDASEDMKAAALEATAGVPEPDSRQSALIAPANPSVESEAPPKAPNTPQAVNPSSSPQAAMKEKAPLPPKDASKTQSQTHGGADQPLSQQAAADARAQLAAADTHANEAETGKLQSEIAATLHKDAASQTAPNVEVKSTSEGVLISLTDEANYAMFAVGSAEPQKKTIEVMEKLARLLQSHPGMIIIRGHTDGRPYKSGTYDNWQLSAARAQMAHYMLVRGGLDEKRIERIEGYADHRLKIANNPLAAENRRIEILVRKDKP
jgi:chemotaxis protein MotB